MTFYEYRKTRQLLERIQKVRWKIMSHKDFSKAGRIVHNELVAENRRLTKELKGRERSQGVL